MREAIAAYRAGECDMPMPMHLEIAPERGEVHIKSSYRRGGKYFVLKVASTFPNNLARGISTSSGMMLLCSAETGQPVALLADEGHLTDVRTAAVAAMVAQDFGRNDTALGILGTGVQARLQAADARRGVAAAPRCDLGTNPRSRGKLPSRHRSLFARG